MTEQHSSRDPFFDGDQCEHETPTAHERWIAALKLANSVNPKLPGVLLDLAGGLTQEAAAKRAKVAQSTVSEMITKLRAKKTELKGCDLN